MKGGQCGSEPAREPATEACGWPRHRRLFERARPHLQTRHNDVHTRISCAFAARLLEREPGDPEVVIPAVLLHDIGWSKVPEELQLLAFGPRVKDPELTKVHEREGARMAAEVLRELGYSDEMVREICEIISGHDTRLTALSANDAVVKDADKLFRFSGIGFPIDCGRFRIDPPKHLAWLEKQIDRWLFTDTGRDLARQEASQRWRELGPTPRMRQE